jgi:DNA polymerase elongation subunit (family B)
MNISVLDTETLAYPDEVILANAPAWSEEEALTRKGNRTKPETISSFLEEDQRDYTKNLLEKAALNPETAKLAVVGTWGKMYGFAQDSLGNMTEEELLKYAMRLLLDPTSLILGWNFLGFDLPFLLKRCWIVGVDVPTSVFNPLHRYSTPDRFVDMMDKFKAGNFKASYTSLDSALRIVDKSKPDGSQFGKLWKEDRQKALDYNREEIENQVLLYRRMGVKL